jgi:hypothetical protein
MNTISYSKRDLEQLDTIEQSWNGDYLKIHDENVKVWLTHPENRQYDGDYTIETRINGVWYATIYYFE